MTIRFILTALVLSWATPQFCAADDKLIVQRFLESATVLPYDHESEMTDVILVNAFFTDEARIVKLANSLIESYSGFGEIESILGDKFNSLKLTTNNSNIIVRSSKRFMNEPCWNRVVFRNNSFYS